jgi:hypothetical protein
MQVQVRDEYSKPAKLAYMGKALTCHTKRKEGKEIAIIAVLANR